MAKSHKEIRLFRAFDRIHVLREKERLLEGLRHGMPSSWHDPVACPISRHHIGWQHHPSLAGEPKTAEADVPQPHPYCLQSYPSYPWDL